MIDRNSINIVEEIRANDIKGEVPKSAEYAAINPTSKFIEKFYRFTNVKFNDGTNADIFQYWSEGGGWYNSSYNTNPKSLKEKKFFKILPL